MIMAKDSNNNYVNIEDIEAKNNNEYQDIEKIVSKQGNLLYNKYKETEDTLPINFKGKGKDLKNYRIYGNTVNGESVGDRTANLFANLWKKGYIRADNGREEQTDGFICSGFFPVEYGQTYSISRNINVGYDNVRGYRDDGSFIGAGTDICDVNNPFPNGATKIGAFTVTNENVAFVRFNDYANDLGMKYMIVKGTYTKQTMPDYEPYGYKVPVTVERSAPHTATLQLHDCLPSTMQFDAPEALYYAENGLTAGTYNFTIQDSYGTSYGGGKTYQFTLANGVPANGQLVFDWAPNTQASAAKITSYASSTSTTAIEQVGVTEGSGGTSLGTTDGNSTNVNHIRGVRYGSNNYKESAIRQFLNSSAVAGSVWTPQTKYDRPPSWNASTAGFMKDIGSDFLAVLGASPKVVALNTVTDGGGSVTINNDKFFLLSRSEVYGGKENDINEGEPYPYYSNYSDLSAAGIGDDSNRIKYRSGTAQAWWLRSPCSPSGNFVRCVTTSGYVGNVSAYDSRGVAPACNIALDEDYKFNGQVLHVRDQISVTKGNQTLVFDVIGIDHDEVHFDKRTVDIYLPEPIKMVGDEAEYVDYTEQKQHRVRKNLLQNTATSQTINGVTFTVNSDGSVTCNGTANNTILYEIHRFPRFSGKCILSGCPINGSKDTCRLQYTNMSNMAYQEYGPGVDIYQFDETQYPNSRINIRIENGYTCNNLTFYPMIRKANIEDDTYEPYITNTELDVTLPALPTLSGTNTLTVGTEVQPSSVYLKGKLKRTIYGWHVDPDISDSSNAVTYLKDAIGMTPASMGSSTFNYGSWQNAFFMPKPCMLKSNGKVDYYLDPNDYTKKLNGTASDISNPNYDGNAMMQWPKIWFKYVKGVKEGQGYFYVANYKADGNFHCWCNYDSENNEIDHFYTAIYNGTSFANYSSSKTYVINDFAIYDNKLYKCNTDITTAQEFDNTKWNLVSNTAPAINKMRSLSGIRLTGNNGNAQTNTTTEVTRATANNTTSAAEWYIETFSDRLLINGLLVLMGKSLNTQAAFGRGLDSDATLLAKEAYITGTLNDKGLFYGVIGDGQSNGKSAVKVFGMENFWGCAFHRTAGLITDNHVIKLKLTYGTKDGSTVVGYNQTGNGYIDNGISPFDNGYIQKMSYNKYGFIPAVVTEESQSTYYADYCYEDASYTGISYALFGGHGSGPSSRTGAFSLFQRGDPEYTSRRVAASLSCKPISLFN